MKRRCAVVGCSAFPDAAWGLCSEHLAEIERQVEEDSEAAETHDSQVGQ